MSVEVSSTALHDYIKQNPRFVAAYENSTLKKEFVDKIRAKFPAGRIVTICEFWCGDCRRHVPRMARVADYLPQWSFDILAWDKETHDRPWQVRAIPTFVVFDGDREIGRIVENPRHGSIEEDLWEIVDKM